MSSLVTKTNKSGSAASKQLRTVKGKKAAEKKPQRPGKITAAPKAKKTVVAKSRKQVPMKKVVASAKKKVSPKKAVPVRSKKSTAKTASRTKLTTAGRPATASTRAKAAGNATARTANKAIFKAPAKVAQPLPKKQPSANALLAVKAFEQALRTFNRHDYSAAKEAFEGLLLKFMEQPDIVAPARTYLSICVQRLARTPVAPRSPDALYDQGVILLNKGRLAEAVTLFDKALKTEPRADHVWYSLSAAYARMNEPTKSIDALRRAIGLRSVHRSHARRDPDFASLHTSEEFQHLTGFGFDLDDE